MHLIAATAAQQEFVVHAGDVLELVALLVVTMVAVVSGYRAMQRPRLVVRVDEQGRYRARPSDVVKYTVSMPFLIMLWFLALTLILVFTNNGLTGPRVLVVSAGIIIAARLLAHLSHEHAHELAKSVPLTIVTLLIVTSNGWRADDSLNRLASELDRTEITGSTMLLLIGSEFLVCAVWYWVGVRWWYVRDHDVPGLPRRTHDVDPGHAIADRVTLRRSE